MKKLLALIVAMAMILSLATTAFAAEGDEPEAPATPETYSITINNSATGHTYEAYQIFVGELSEEAENDNNGNTTTTNNTTAVLSNVQWGASVTNKSALDSAASVAERLADNYEGDDGLDIDDLLDMITLGAPVKNSGNTCNPYVIDGLEPGYYLIKDKDGSLNGTNDSYTKFILEVLENSTIKPKSSKPSVQKKVDDINDSNNTENAVDWKDSADYDIGDPVPFQLKATLASNVADYNTYKIVFHDTMSKGLTFQEITKVTIDGNVITSGYDVYTKTNEDGTTYLVISFDNIKAQGGTNNSEVIVEYVAELNEEAEVGSLGNPNEVYLEYSNNPNWEGFPDNYEDGDNDKDGIPDDEDDDDDNDGKKDDEDDDDDNDGKKDDEDDDDDNDGTPDDKEEPTGKTPEDKVIVFTYQTIVNKVDQNNNALAGATFELYKKTAGADPEWVLVDKMVMADNQATFTWTGLDDGEYMLHESVTPTGYNSIDDIYFTISATHDLEAADPKLLTLTVDNEDFDVDFENGVAGPVYSGNISTAVINNAGATLPETGGIGTTIFYAAGAMLVLCAVILLITKKRMGAAE